MSLRQLESKSIWSLRPRLPCHPTKVPDFEGWSNSREARACSQYWQLIRLPYSLV